MTKRQARSRLMWLSIFIVAGSIETSGETLRCGSALRLASAGEGDAAPRYAPDRPVDITHVTIDVTPDFDAQTIRGTTVISFTPLVKPLTELKLDAVDLNITSVESQSQLTGYTKTDTSIRIAFNPPVLPGDATTVTIRYDAEPQRGLYFRTPSAGVPRGRHPSVHAGRVPRRSLLVSELRLSQ